MKEFSRRLFAPVWKFINRYPIVFAALAIYLYYLLTSINFFTHVEEKKSLLDYVLQFDSLIWMWVAAAALLQVQRLRRQERAEVEARQAYQIELERQQIHTQLLGEITALLQDNINNPLAIISAQAQQIRKRFEADHDIIRWIDSIESALKRIEYTIREIKAYESEKMIASSQERFEKLRVTGEDALKGKKKTW
jgi:signal transduction histidine kinase